MEDAKCPTSRQGYRDRRMENRRFFRNKREDNSSSQMPRKGSNQNSRKRAESKVNCVKPQYPPSERIKIDEVKPPADATNVHNVIRDRCKSSSPRNDTGPRIKDQRTCPRDDERQRYSSKERNGRHLRGSNTRQGKTKEPTRAQLNNATIAELKDEQNIENDVSEKLKDGLQSSATQYLKPAVHVQPLQQRAEEQPLGISEEVQDPSHPDLEASDSCSHEANWLNQDSKTRNAFAKETNIERSPHEGGSKMFEPSSVTKRTPEGSTFYSLESKPTPDFRQNSSFYNQLPGFVKMKPCSEGKDRTVCAAASSAQSDFHPESNYTKSLDQHMSSDVFSTLRAVDLETARPGDQSAVHHRLPDCRPSVAPCHLSECQSVTNVNADNENLSMDRKEVPEMSPAQEQREVTKPLVSGLKDDIHSAQSERQSVDDLADEKYGYRISVDSLFSTSFFTNTLAGANTNKALTDETRKMFENQRAEGDNQCEIRVKCDQGRALNMEGSRKTYPLEEAPTFEADNRDKSNEKETLLLAQEDAFPCPSFDPRVPEYKQGDDFDSRLVSPRNRSEHVGESMRSHDLRNSKLASSGNDVLHRPDCGVRSHCMPHFVKDSSSATHKKAQIYQQYADDTKSDFYDTGAQNGSLPIYLDHSKIHAAKQKVTGHPVQKLDHDLLKHSERTHSETITRSSVGTSCLGDVNYDSIEKHSPAFATEVAYPVTANKTSLASSAERDRPIEKQKQHLLRHDANDEQGHKGAVTRGPFMPNLFLGHSLLTHRHAIPSAFVYPSRVGMSCARSGLNDVGQHSVSSPSSHFYHHHGATVCVNVGGRLFEMLPSTFSAYPESVLYQIFTGAVSAPINQRGQIFFDRDGYLFEIILSFARVGHLSLPPRVSLTALAEEAEFFGMYSYMFQQDSSFLPDDDTSMASKGQVPSSFPFHFQRTTSCTLSLDVATKKSDSKVFVLQGEDKLKIESLKVTGSCLLFVDLYTPGGQKETSSFLLYDAEKPDLWKAYQFCAERQLVFHLGVPDTGKLVDASNPSVDIVFAQTFVFHGDEFIP